MRNATYMITITIAEITREDETFLGPNDNNSHSKTSVAFVGIEDPAPLCP